MSITVTIEKLVYGGEGLARTPDGIVLVPNALPGERVEIEPEPIKRGVRRAQLLHILEPSSYRNVPECPYFAECGGCHHQQANYEQQLAWKQAILAECFERIGKLKLDVPINTVASEPWAYRNRIRLHALKEGDAFRVGFQKPSSNELSTIENCAISAPSLQSQINELSSGSLSQAFPSGELEIELFDPNDGREFLATITSDSPAPENFGEIWKSAFQNYESVCWTYKPKASRPGAHPPPVQKIWGSGAVTARVGEYHYRVSHESFFQTNRFLLEKMIATVLNDTTGDRALDLFAGVGFFTLPLTRRFKHVIAVESHASSSLDLETNAGFAPSQIYAYREVAEHFLASRASRQSWDLLVVDPPRHGLSKPVREAIITLRPRRMAYVSCDPTTLARDLAAFNSYKIASIHLMDLFPQTYHIETIVHLTRKE
jgi:23S rRNA (uracil1939-C5)-methyltransferase